MRDRIHMQRIESRPSRAAREVRETLRDNAVQQLGAAGFGVAVALYIQQGHSPGELLTLRFAGWAALGVVGGLLLGAIARRMVRRSASSE